MNIYYAHCMALYGTPQEKRDIKLISSLFKETLEWWLINPSDEKYVKEYDAWKKEMAPDGNWIVSPMAYWEELVKSCDIMFFRALPDGRIPSGVAAEIKTMQDADKPVIELPSSIKKRSIDVRETAEYLREVGQR